MRALEDVEQMFKSLVDDVQQQLLDARAELSGMAAKSERAPSAVGPYKTIEGTGAVKEESAIHTIFQPYGDGKKGTAKSLFLQWAFQTLVRGVFSIMAFLALLYILAMFVFFFSASEFADLIPGVPNWFRERKEKWEPMVRRRVLRRVFDKKRKYQQISEGEYVKREDETDDKKNMLSKPTDTSYELITGAHGIGKSTAVRKVVQDLVKEGLPIVYLGMEGDSPIQELARELGAPTLSDDETSNGYISRVIGVGLFPPLLDDIREQLEKNGDTSGYPLTIVVNNVNNLLIKDVEMLVRLQQMIKGKCIEPDRAINIVFVSSDGHAPKSLWSKSESSRMFETRLFEATGEIAEKLLSVVASGRDLNFRRCTEEGCQIDRWCTTGPFTLSCAFLEGSKCILRQDAEGK